MQAEGFVFTIPAHIRPLIKISMYITPRGILIALIVIATPTYHRQKHENDLYSKLNKPPNKHMYLEINIFSRFVEYHNK